jgi:hypothetical protein
VLAGTRLWRGWSRSTPNTGPPCTQGCSLKVLWKMSTDLLTSYRKQCRLVTVPLTCHCTLRHQLHVLGLLDNTICRKRNPPITRCQIPDLAPSRCLYRSLQLRSVTCSHSCTLKMEVIRSSETSVLIRATRCHLPEDDNHHSSG